MCGEHGGEKEWCIVLCSLPTRVLYTVLHEMTQKKCLDVGLCAVVPARYEKWADGKRAALIFLGSGL